MRQKIICLVIVSIAVAFATFNVYTIQIKNSKSLTAYSALLLTQPFDAFAQNEYKPSDYPPDPNEGIGPGVAMRDVDHSETIIKACKGRLCYTYSYPTTTVYCYLQGDIPCISGVYLGTGTLIDITVVDEK